MNKLIICTAVAALGSVSQAAVLIGNLPAVNSLTHSADLGSSRLKGIGFTTPGQDWKLNSATFSLGFDFDDIANGVTPIVRIHDVVGGNPGSVLHTMVDPGGYISGSVDNYTFTANGSFTFLANTS
ncbi:MAG: hypothetical protein KDC26_07700, partial [Armatimonadetes bacterium]|nr:hypothetical protein [Armatimonadota bacterium]